MRFLSRSILLMLLCVQPLVADGQTSDAIPTDFFPGVTLDSALVVPFVAYTPIHVSGTVSDSLVVRVGFHVAEDCDDVGNCPGLYSHGVTVRERRFSRTLFFSNEQTGEFQFEISTGREDELNSRSGVFRPFSIRRNTQTSPIPVDFFRDIELSLPFPAEFTTGEAFRFEGTVSDPMITSVKVLFWYEGGFFPFNAPVIDGRIKKTIFFAHKQAGVYDLQLDLEGGKTRGAAHDHFFSPIVVSEGEGTAFLPFDFFEEVTLTSPVPVVLKAGQPLRVTGTVSDNSVSQIEFLFVYARRDPDGRPIVIRKSFKEHLANGEFGVDVNFPLDQQLGDYTLYVYLWRRDSRSLGPRIFKPLTLLAPPLPDFDGDGTVGFPDFILFANAFGTSSAVDDFDTQFDLDGDGVVGFSDFLIFSKAFGQRVGN